MTPKKAVFYCSFQQLLITYTRLYEHWRKWQNHWQHLRMSVCRAASQLSESDVSSKHSMPDSTRVDHLTTITMYTLVNRPLVKLSLSSYQHITWAQLSHTQHITHDTWQFSAAHSCFSIWLTTLSLSLGCFWPDLTQVRTCSPKMSFRKPFEITDMVLLQAGQMPQRTASKYKWFSSYLGFICSNHHCWETNILSSVIAAT